MTTRPDRGRPVHRRRRPAADRQPLHRLRHRDVPRAGLVPAVRVDGPMAEHLLARRGRLWAWTTQGFPPPTPPYLGAAGKDFVPFGVGYVELGDVKVEARLTESDPDVLRPRHDDGAGPGAVPHRRRRQRRRHVRVPPRRRGGLTRHERRRRRHRGGHAPLRPVPRRVRDRDGRGRDPARARRRRRRVAPDPVRVRRELRGRQPGCRGRAHGPHRDPVHRRVQRLRDRGERAVARGPDRSASASTSSASRSGWTSTCPARSAPTRGSTPARRGTARSGSSSPRSSSG